MSDVLLADVKIELDFELDVNAFASFIIKFSLCLISKIFFSHFREHVRSIRRSAYL